MTETTETTETVAPAEVPKTLSPAEMALENENVVAPPPNPTLQYGVFADASRMSDKGIHRLLVGERGIIKQAVEDYKDLVRSGVIVDGKLAVTQMPRKVCDGITIPEVKDLIAFFKDENIGILLGLGGINIEPHRFRKQLGMPQWQ